MTLPKQAVVIDREGGALHRISATLDDLGFEVTFVRELGVAVDLVCEMPRLSFLAVSEDVAGPSADSFLTTVKRLHRELPVLWVGREGVPQTQFTQFVPDLFLSAPLDPAGLAGPLQRLLREHYYPMAIVDSLREGAREILRDGFGTTVETGETFLRANRSLLAEMNALIGFCGGGVAGYVVVSGDADHFAAIHKRAAPASGAPTADRAPDVAAELANQILGRVGRHLRRVVTSFAIGLPMVIQGSRTLLHRFQARPAVVVQLLDGGRSLYVEFCLETFDPTTKLEVLGPDEGAMPDGSLSFFDP